MKIEAHTIELAGRAYENAESLKERLQVSEYTIRLFLDQGMPGPVKIGRVRYFDRDETEAWIVAHRK